VNETATEAVVIDEQTGETEVDLVRHLILATHDDVVAELIAGKTIPELMDSIEPAQEAHRNVVAKLSPPAPPAVPPGAALGVADPDDLPAHELIRRGLMTRS
jgi:hypothetical protein